MRWERMQVQEAFGVDVLSPDKEEEAFFRSVGEKVVAGKSPVGNKDGRAP